MDELKQWQETQAQDIQAFCEEIAQWQTELKKDARDWKNNLLRETNALKNQVMKESQEDFRVSVDQWMQEKTQEVNRTKQVLQAEIDAMKGEVTDGNSRTTRESSSPTHLLGSPDGAGDQTEADNIAGRKGRRRPSGTQ
jgi:hypothetical protein